MLLTPFKPIEKFKQATPCSALWEGTDPKERVRYCEQCKRQVYDFAGLELPEAEALIFKRENRKNVTLFKRVDGKFLTSDCPVGVKKRLTLILANVGGVVLLCCVLALFLSTPKPAPSVVKKIHARVVGGSFVAPSHPIYIDKRGPHGVSIVNERMGPSHQGRRPVL